LSTAGNCWPTSEQQLLLRAAVLRGAEALAAWQRWTQAVDLDTLDPGSIRLLPQLYRNLEREGVRDPLMSKLKGVYRHTWYGNQLRLRDTAVVLSELHRRGIEPMLLKGAALTLLHYRDSGLRPMEDVDVLVRTHQWQAAVDALTDLGWKPRVSVTPRHAAASHAMEFVDGHARRIDLHWHLLPDSCWPRADNEFWERASTTALHGVRVSVLDATDQLFHTCAHGVKWEHVPPLRWIADAAMILGDSSVTIDWGRLVRLADRLRLILPVRDGLTLLERTLDLPVPRPVLAGLQNTRVSRAERWEYRLRTRPASRALGRLPEHWLRYRRLRRAPEGLRPITFVGYLQVILDCDGIGALARRAVFRHRWRRSAEHDARSRERGLSGASLP
jgi:hypothetical protein